MRTNNLSIVLAIVSAASMHSVALTAKPKRAAPIIPMMSAHAAADSVARLSNCADLPTQLPALKPIQPLLRAYKVDAKEVQGPGYTTIRTDLTKDEFETESQFESRRAAIYAKRFGNPERLFIRDKISPSSIKYDADRQIVTVKPFFAYWGGNGLSENDFATLSVGGGDDSKESTYMAQNAYGVRAEVTRYQDTSHYVALDLSAVPRPRLAIEIPMAPEAARMFKTRAELLVLGALQKPYVVLHHDYEPATLHNPTSYATDETYFVVKPKCMIIMDGTSPVRSWSETYDGAL